MQQSPDLPRSSDAIEPTWGKCLYPSISNSVRSRDFRSNGQMGHVLDFDDTRMGGVVLHASSPVLAALRPAG
jgi:hypothetical protein